jgi:ATP-grasp domain
MLFKHNCTDSSEGVTLTPATTDDCHDVSRRLAPLTADEAIAMLKELRGDKLLIGARGRARADIDALAKLVAQVSEPTAIRDQRTAANSAYRKTASRRPFRISIRCLNQASSATAFRFLHQPSRPNAPRPAAKRFEWTGNQVAYL